MGQEILDVRGTSFQRKRLIEPLRDRIDQLNFLQIQFMVRTVQFIRTKICRDKENVHFPADFPEETLHGKDETFLVKRNYSQLSR